MAVIRESQETLGYTTSLLTWLSKDEQGENLKKAYNLM